MMPSQNKFEEVVGLYERKGFGRGRVGVGKRPALLVVDLARAWIDPASPLDQISRALSTILSGSWTSLGR